ncbi:MAG TPA: M23 family metallopeptidase, partial [Candidatus Hydrogenedentes bacterium]|nr:M23 family metallopeptidase [Candidatus Hydrogenedentota bacterium]
GFRKDPFTGKRAFHSGVDLTSDSDAEIRAFATGTVVHSGWMPGYGKTVVLRHADGTETLYGHCEKINVSPGMVVARGSTLGVMGSTGRSTGEHLHFEVRRNGRPVDPLKVLIGEQQYGQYYASRARHTVTGDLSGKTNSVRRAVKGYTTFPAALSVRVGRP